MKNGIVEIREVKDISAALTRENKKYVIAVANALLFSQRSQEQPRKPPAQALETLGMAKANIERARDWARATVRACLKTHSYNLYVLICVIFMSNSASAAPLHLLHLAQISHKF